MNTTERSMAAAILRFEDSRVTGPASLRGFPPPCRRQRREVGNLRHLRRH